MFAAVDQRPAVGKTEKNPIPFTIERCTGVANRSAWRAKKGDAINMRVGGVTVRIAGSKIVFDAEAVITFANDTDTDPDLRVMFPRNRFAPIFVAEDKTTSAAYDEFETACATAWAAWADKQTDLAPLTDAKYAVGLIGTTGKRGVKLGKR